MVSRLTSGAIQRILNGEDVSNAVIQLLGCKKIPGTGNDRYRLLISDGATGCPFAMLGTQLNHMVVNKELEKFTIVRVEKCVCNQVQPDRKVIIILNLTVLTPGAEVGEKLGNPVNSVSSTSNADSSSNSSNATRDTHANGQHNRNAPSAAASYKSELNGSVPNVHPISSLTPYQNKWTIKARVTTKSNVRTWNNSRGEGKLFTVTLLDESGEIRATGFNDCVDKYFDMMEVNKVFYITRATLKTANKQYSSIKNDYEMTFNNDTTVAPCEDNSSSIPMVQFDFVPISQIEQIEKDNIIDVIGVCKGCSDVQTIVSRNNNKEYVKRSIQLVDRTNKEVSLTIWSTEAENFDGSMNPVVAIKGAKVSDFNGRSLSTINSSCLQINPDIKEAHVLKGWYDREGCNTQVQSISGRSGAGSGSMGGDWKTFAQASAEQLGMGEKPDYYVNKCTIVLIRKENCMYMACPTEECNKKVIDMNNGLYRCEKCNREHGSFRWRLLLSASVADFSESIWVTCFQEAAESLLGVDSQELGSLKESDEDRYNEILLDANFKSYNFKFRTKMERFNEEFRLKTTAVSVAKIDPVIYGKKLLADIKQMQEQL